MIEKMSVYLVICLLLAWLRKGEESLKARVKVAFEDLNNVGTLA